MAYKVIIGILTFIIVFLVVALYVALKTINNFLKGWIK